MLKGTYDDPALINLVLYNIGEYIPTHEIHSRMIEEISKIYPGRSEHVIARMAASSVGGAFAHGTIEFRHHQRIIVRVKHPKY